MTPARRLPLLARRRSELLRKLAVCLAFSTCCFLNTWVELAEGGKSYFSRFDPLRATVPAVVAWQIIVAAAMFLAWRVLSRSPARCRAVANTVFLLCCFVPAGIVGIAALRASPMDLVPIVRRTWFWPAVLAAAAPFAFFALRRPPAAARIVRAVLLGACPVLAVVVFQGIRTLLRYPHDAYLDSPPALRLPAPPSAVRVVWIVFDGLSQAIAFDHRPADLSLPEFDRLRSESFHASSARSPAGFTTESLPALILGEHVDRVEPQGPASALIQVPSRPALVEWRSLSNVFDKARLLGFNCALAGWHHPYGRLLNRTLVACDSSSGGLPSGLEEPAEPQSVIETMRDRLRAQISALPLLGHFPGAHPAAFHLEQKRRRFLLLFESAKRFAADPSIGLVLLHLQIPHPPAFYSRRQQQFTSTGHVGYIDSVALADRALGQLRRAMERSGSWSRTAVIVSADHGWRTALWRGGPDWTAEEEAASRGIDTLGVPFLVRLPGHATGLGYAKPFDTIVTADIILDILRGSLVSPDQIPERLDRRDDLPGGS